MSILNETRALEPNILYIIVTVAMLITGVVFRLFANKRSLKNWQFALLMFLSIACFGLAPLVAGNYRDPDTYVPTGKRQIEAVFPKGKPTAYILDKYDVIEQRGRIWVLEEK